MLEISKFISKPVLSVDLARKIGVVQNVYFDEMLKNVAYFLMLDNDGQTQKLPFQAVLSFSDALMTVSQGQAQNEDLNVCAPLGLSVYTQTGIYNGDVQQIECTKSGAVVKIRTAQTQFTPNAISKVGEFVLLKATPPTRKQKTLPRPQHNYPVYLLNDGAASFTNEIDDKGESHLQAANNTDVSVVHGAVAPQSAHIPISSAPEVMTLEDTKFSRSALQSLVGAIDISFDKTNEHTPSRIICNYDFLLGRKLTHDLTTYTNDLIAKKDSVVTPQVLQKARHFGKLVELTLNSTRGDM